MSRQICSREGLSGMMRFVLAAIAVTVWSCAAYAQAPAADKASAGRPRSVTIELNKLEPQGATCRAYFVIINRSETEFADIQLDVFLFDKQGIVARRAALATRQLQPGKTNIRLFDLVDTPCDTIGRLVLNEVLACKNVVGAPANCQGMLALSSRAGVEFVD
jgi:hypothetical protein